MELHFSNKRQSCEEKKRPCNTRRPREASGAKASVELLLIRLKPSVEIMECQAVCSSAAASGQGLFSGHSQFIVELSGVFVDLIQWKLLGGLLPFQICWQTEYQPPTKQLCVSKQHDKSNLSNSLRGKTKRQLHKQLMGYVTLRVLEDGTQTAHEKNTLFQMSKKNTYLYVLYICLMTQIFTKKIYFLEL